MMKNEQGRVIKKKRVYLLRDLLQNVLQNCLRCCCVDSRILAAGDAARNAARVCHGIEFCSSGIRYMVGWCVAPEIRYCNVRYVVHMNLKKQVGE